MMIIIIIETTHTILCVVCGASNPVSAPFAPSQICRLVRDDIIIMPEEDPERESVACARSAAHYYARLLLLQSSTSGENIIIIYTRAHIIMY